MPFGTMTFLIEIPVTAIVDCILLIQQKVSERKEKRESELPWMAPRRSGKVPEL